MTTSRPNIDQLSFCIKNSHRLKDFRGSICGKNLLSFGVERAAAAAQNLGCSGCEGGVLRCCLGENGGGEGGGEVRGGGEEEDGEEGRCCVVLHFVVRRSSFVLRSSRRGKSGRNLNPPYLGVKPESKTNLNRQQEKKSSSKQTSRSTLYIKKHIKVSLQPTFRAPFQRFQIKYQTWQIRQTIPRLSECPQIVANTLCKQSSHGRSLTGFML